MKFIKQIICQKCSHLNPLYTSICQNCKSYLRERVVNIDLWKTIGQLIEDPINAFRQIIFAENKNYILFILLLLSVKNLIVSRFFSVAFMGKEGVTSSLFLSYLMIFILTFLTLIAFTFLLKILYKKIKIDLRFKDVFSANIYSFSPFIIGLVFIFPVELIVLGGDLFSNNPNPFQIKPTVSYMLAGFEILSFLWSIFLVFKSIFYVSSRLKLAILLTIILFILFIALYFFSSRIIFSV